MTRTQILLPLLCLVLMGIGVVCWKFPPAPTAAAESPAIVTVGSREQEAPLLTDSAPTTSRRPAAIETPIVPIRDAHRSAPPVSNKSVPPKNVDLTASSWENPFSAEYWKSEGWTFTPQGMRTVSAETTYATFLRPYQKLMFECDIVADPSPGGRWELRLATKNSQVIMSLIIHDGRLSVVATENGLSQVVIDKPLTVPLSTKVARQIRVVATGNRIVISWDRRRFLATQQLVAQSGRDILWSLHTEGAVYEIPKLRVEGD